jgi:taurine dioxygenase
MHMDVKNFDGRIGAEVSFDYHDDWTEETVEQLRAAFRERHLLLLRAPDLTAEEQIRVLESLGLAVDVWTDGNRYGFLSNNLKTAPNDGQHNAYLYHSDLMWKEQPIASISLYAIAIPDEPAPTLFASGVGAAASMPSDVKAEFAEYEGLFLIDFTGGDQRYSEDTSSAEAPRATHPLLYEDPVSGQTSLIVDSLFMDKVVGKDRAEAEAIRDRAHQFLYATDNVYQHDWTVGDLVVWNNVALQHSRPKLPEQGDRTFRRVSGTYDHATTSWEASFRDNVGAAS